MGGISRTIAVAAALLTFTGCPKDQKPTDSGEQEPRVEQSFTPEEEAPVFPPALSDCSEESRSLIGDIVFFTHVRGLDLTDIVSDGVAHGVDVGSLRDFYYEGIAQEKRPDDYPQGYSYPTPEERFNRFLRNVRDLVKSIHAFPCLAAQVQETIAHIPQPGTVDPFLPRFGEHIYTLSEEEKARAIEQIDALLREKYDELCRLYEEIRSGQYDLSAEGGFASLWKYDISYVKIQVALMLADVTHMGVQVAEGRGIRDRYVYPSGWTEDDIALHVAFWSGKPYEEEWAAAQRGKTVEP